MNRMAVAATCVALGASVPGQAGVIVQTCWNGGSEEAAKTALTETTQVDTLEFMPFDSGDGSRLLTSVEYRIRTVATQDWVADNDFDEATVVYATMTRRAEVRLPADLAVYDTGVLYAESDPFELAADTLPDGNPDVDRTPTNQDTTGWRTLDVDWGWSAAQSIAPEDFAAFSGSGNVAVTVQPTRLLYGAAWGTCEGTGQLLFTNAGMGCGVEITYEYDLVPTPEPSCLVLAGWVAVSGLVFRRRRPAV